MTPQPSGAVVVSEIVRLVRTILAAAAILAVVPASAPAKQAPVLRADTPTCRTGVTPAERFAVFSGSMPAKPGAVRMAMRFDLQLRESSRGRFRTVRAPSFGRWERSKPGRSGFIYSKRVDGMEAPATYRAVVRFRWLDDAGHTVARATRYAPRCTQPDPRPNLRLLALRATPGPAAGVTTYLLTIVNSGRGPAGAFDVAVGPDDGGAATTATVGGMAAREVRVLEVTARACDAKGRVRVRLDTGAAVAESDEQDNDVRRDCPSPG